MSTETPSLDAIFCAAVEIPSEADRAEYIAKACGDDGELRAQVEKLAVAHFRAGSFLESSAPSPVATVDAPIRERPGTVIGPYKLLQAIGEGGMGAVFMAEQTHPVQRKVALKVIKPGMDSRQVVARFEAERQALAMMDHVNIARVLDAGATESGRPYFVMELVHGVPITKYCDDNRLTPRDRLELFVPVCHAIQHAHQKGIIHRDVKPSNVMVTLYDGKPVPKVIDFGVAKATEQKLTERTLFTQYGTMVGTPQYMSPEQAEMSALGVDTRSDIYSLGVLLYELLTGGTPLSHKRLKDAAYGEVLRMIREEEPPRPSTRLSDSGGALASISTQRHMEPAKLTKLVRGELDWIVMKCLEKDRNRRYEMAGALAADVQRYLNDEPVQACPPSAWYRLRKFAHRNKGPVAGGLALATLLVLGTVGTSIGLAWALQAEHTATVAAGAEANAKGELKKTLDNERQDAYFRCIALAYRELSADNLGRALELLGQCPEDLRDWEWRYLMRLCRVGPVVLRDKTEVNSLAFSPGGESIASAGADGAVKVWNSKTGRVIQSFPAHAGFASSVAFHPDGEHLASVGADNLVKVWNWRTGDQVFAAPCDAVHQFGTAYAAAFSPLDPNQLAVGRDGGVTLWDWRSEKPLHTFPGHEKGGISVAFSRDGRRLASGDWRGSVKLWDAVAWGEPLCTFPESREGHHAVGALAFSRDGEQLATASFGRRVDVWDTTTGRFIRMLEDPGRLVQCVAFSPDGRLIASAGEGKTVHVWDATTTTGRELLGLRGHTRPCGCVAFSPDGLRLASAGMDGTIRLWDATPLQGDERQEASTFTGQGDEIWSLAVSPDGQRIVSGGFGRLTKIWDAKTRRVSAEFGGQRSVVFGVAWHPDGLRIASAGVDGGVFTVKVWNAQTEEQDFVLTAGAEFQAVAFSPPDGRFLVTGNAKGLVQVWDARDGREIRTLGVHKGPVRQVEFSRDRDRQYLASVSADGTVNVWDATRLGEKPEPQKPPELLRTLPAHFPGPCSNLAAFSPDGKRLAIGDKEYTVRIWDVETGQELPTLRGHNGDVCAVAFSPDREGRWIASAGEDSTVKIWDSHTGALVHTFRGHTGIVSCMAFMPDGKSLVSGSRDHTVKFWDMTQLEDASDR